MSNFAVTLNFSDESGTTITQTVEAPTALEAPAVLLAKLDACVNGLAVAGAPSLAEQIKSVYTFTR